MFSFLAVSHLGRSIAPIQQPIGEASAGSKIFGGFLKWGYPKSKNGWSIMENSMKIDDLEGFPLSEKLKSATLHSPVPNTKAIV